MLIIFIKKKENQFLNRLQFIVLNNKNHPGYSTLVNEFNKRIQSTSLL